MHSLLIFIALLFGVPIVQAERGWGEGGTGEMRLLLHATAWSGRYLVIVDSERTEWPGWSPAKSLDKTEEAGVMPQEETENQRKAIERQGR